MRRRLTALAVTGLLALTMPAGAALAADGQQDPSPEPDAETAASERFTVMTWNIHVGIGKDDGELDLGEIADRILRHEPDVVALQEIHRKHEGDPPNDEPNHGDQIERMKELLDDGGYDYSYARPGQAGSGKLIVSRLPLSDRHWIDLPKGVGNRGLVIWAKVHLPDGNTVRVYNTHLQSGSGNDEIENRQAEVRKILNKRTIRSLNKPVVLVGDFNLRPYHGLKYKFANRGFIDTWTMVRDGEEGLTVTKGHGGDCEASSDQPVRRIDYVFGSPAIEAIDGEVDCDTYASDHKPVIMTLRVDHKADQIEISGAVRAGLRGKGGWAHLVVYEDKSSKLITCDNRASGWDVASYGQMPYQGESGRFITDYDEGSHRDQCVKREVGPRPDANFHNLALKTCVSKENGPHKDCRKHGILERTYRGQGHNAGYAQFRLGVDNWMTVEVCDTKPDGKTVRAKVWNGRADTGRLIASRKTEGHDPDCDPALLDRGPWPWKSDMLTTETCLLKDGEEKGCKRKRMAYAP